MGSEVSKMQGARGLSLATITIILLFGTASAALAAAKPISCSFLPKGEKQIAVNSMQCPPRDVYASLRVLLYLSGEIPDVVGGEVCQLKADVDKEGKVQVTVSYRNTEGKQKTATIKIREFVLREEH